MKILKIIIVLFAFNLVSANENASVKIDDLAKEMGNSKEVLKFMTNKLLLKIYQECKIDYKLNSEEFENKASILINDNILLQEKINIMFPDFYNLNQLDREKVIGIIIETSYSWANYWKCIESKITTSALVASLTAGLGAIYIKQLKRCLYWAFAADVAEDAASVGSATPILAEEFVGEANFCKYLSGGSAAVATGEVLAFITGLFSCTAAD
jgi:hypothetical protein